jgi:hypothetical protein
MLRKERKERKRKKVSLPRHANPQTLAIDVSSAIGRPDSFTSLPV